MFSVYDKNRIVFSSETRSIDFQFGANILDFEDTFVIETQIAIDDLARGWIGDVRIVFNGRSLDSSDNWNEKADDVVLYKDALCYRRTVEYDYPQAATWKYMFMKY